jgi:hypothetical protein
MTQDEIIKMLEASCDKDKVHPYKNGFWVIVTEELVRFANAVAQHEREACAKVCEQSDDNGDGPDCWDWHSKDYATAIRAREQHE